MDKATQQKRLGKFFKESCTALDIAEPLFSIDVGASRDDIINIMKKKQVFVLGARLDGSVIGYIEKEKIEGSEQTANYEKIVKDQTVDEYSGINEAVCVLENHKYCLT